MRFPGFWILGFTLFCYDVSAIGTGFVFPLFLTGSGLDAAASTSVMSLGSINTIRFCLVGGVLSDKLFHPKRTPVTMMAFGVSAIFFTIITLYFIACQIMIFVLTLLLHLKCKV